MALSRKAWFRIANVALNAVELAVKFTPITADDVVVEAAIKIIRAYFMEEGVK